MSGRDYVIEMLGRTLAERDQQIAELQRALEVERAKNAQAGE